MLVLSRKFAQILLASVFVLFWAQASGASDSSADMQERQEVIDRFNAADKNDDGKLTREEAQEGMPKVAKSWSRIDEDNKGYITLDQLLSVMRLKD
ncbi:EF-hand domain-containing protein [Orrella marina]|nr:EF-hand domain-containing protein [Orrella marina]